MIYPVCQSCEDSYLVTSGFFTGLFLVSHPFHSLHCQSTVIVQRDNSGDDLNAAKGFPATFWINTGWLHFFLSLGFSTQQNRWSVMCVLFVDGRFDAQLVNR